MGEIIKLESMQLATMEQATEIIKALTTLATDQQTKLQIMADTMLCMKQQMEAMSKSIDQLAMRQPVSRQQKTNLDKAIKDRAAVVSGECGHPLASKAIAMIIKLEIRSAVEKVTGSGCRSMAAVPAVHYQTILHTIQTWDDMVVRRKARRGDLDEQVK